MRVGVGGMGVKKAAGARVAVAVARDEAGGMAPLVGVGAATGVMTVPQPLHTQSPMSRQPIHSQRCERSGFTKGNYTTSGFQATSTGSASAILSA